VDSFLELLLSTLRVSTPLVFAAMGGLLSERSGVVHIALEGFLLVGAFSAAAAAHFTHSPWIGAAVGMGVTAIFALLYGILTVKLRCEQIVAGTAMNFLAFGLTPLFCKALFDSNGATPSLDADSRFVFAPLFLMGFTVLVIHVWLSRYRQGLRLTVAGEKPAALSTAGISVAGVRLKAVILSGLLAGFGGATLSLFLSSSFSKGMTAGRGFMALAALIFGKWKPIPTLLGCLFFGLTDALQIRLQGASFGGISIPVQFIQILPYLVTVVVLAGWVGKSKAPTALGKPFLSLIALTLFSCAPKVEKAVDASPSGTPIAVSRKESLSIKEKDAYFFEMREVLFGDHVSKTPDAEDLGLLHAWRSGASLEGVFHGYVLGKKYRGLEESSSPASGTLIKRFCDVLQLGKNCEKKYSKANAFHLRRVLSESLIRRVSVISKNPQSNEVVKELSAIFLSLDPKGIELGNENRNKMTGSGFASWILKMQSSRSPELFQDQVLWEILNRAIRLLPFSKSSEK
jgi:general nucleoside transport system permease protein